MTNKYNICQLDDFSNFFLDKSPENKSNIFKKIKTSDNKTVIFSSSWLEPKNFSLYSYNNENYLIIKQNCNTYESLMFFLEEFTKIYKDEKNILKEDFNIIFPTNNLFGKCIKVKINYQKISYFTQFNDDLIKLNIDTENNNFTDIRSLITGKKIKIDFNLSMYENQTNYLILSINKIVCEYEKSLDKLIKNPIIKQNKKSKLESNDTIRNRFYEKKYSNKSIQKSNQNIIDMVLNKSN